MRRMLATKRSFIGGTLVEPGFPAFVRDGLETGKNLATFDPSAAVAAVAISPIAPTGPNPVNPQQIPPDARQTITGYVQPGGAKLVSEVTLPSAERFASVGGPPDLSSLMDDGDDGAGDETAKAVIESLGGKTDEELTALRTTDTRKTVQRAIDKELKARKDRAAT